MMYALLARRSFRLATALAAIAAGTFGGAASAVNYGSNLVVNGDAETGTAAGFTTTGGFTALSYTYGGGYPVAGDPGVAAGGGYFFYGGSVASSTATQMFDLTANGTAIDHGRVGYRLSALLGGYATQDDNAIVTARFLGMGGNILGVGSIGPVLAADRGNNTGLLPRATSGFVPFGTRSVDLVVALTRAIGFSNDGYIDNISLVLNQTAVGGVPEPASWALMIAGFGVVGVAARRRRGLVVAA